MKQATFSNNGYEELEYKEIMRMANLPYNPIAEHNSKRFIPRIIRNQYIEEINYFSPVYDNLLFCLCIEQPFQIRKKEYYRRFFFSPSMKLFATLSRENKNNIKKILGQDDNLNSIEQNKLDDIIKHLENANKLQKSILEGNKDDSLSKYSYLIRKRVSNLFRESKSLKVFYNGNAVSSIIKSKFDDSEYKCLLKQPIQFQNNRIDIHPAIQSHCDCGFHEFSTIKYEFFNILCFCSHLELLRQSLEFPELCEDIIIKINKKDIERITNSFNPFKPLDFPQNETNKIRTIIRNGLYNYIVPQEFIRNYYDDSNDYHRRNGFTWFRSELDAYLLSFNEIFDNRLLNIMNEDYNLSIEKTCQFFNDYKDDEKIIISNIEHRYNPDSNKVEHLVEGKWRFIEHGIMDENSEIRPVEFYHNKKCDHILLGSNTQIFENSHEILHFMTTKKPIIDFRSPIKVSKNQDLRLYFSPYKNRKKFN